MTSPQFKNLDSAYQLHHYLLFKSHYRREIFSGAAEREVLTKTVQDVCGREGYHLLETDITPELLRILVSLTPAQTVSQAVQRFKGNTSRQFTLAFPEQLSTLRMPHFVGQRLLRPKQRQGQQNHHPQNTLMIRFRTTDIAASGPGP